jgi:hypothetical protein
MGGHDLFSQRWTHCLISVTKTSETENNVLDIGAIYNLKLRKSFTTKLNAKFPWPPIMPKHFFHFFFPFTVKEEL